MNCFFSQTLGTLKKLESVAMKKSSCELLRDCLPRDSEVEDLYWTSIANCVFNSFLAHTAIMLNIVTMHAIRKTSSIPNTLKALLLSLTVSDVGVGLLVQPYYISLLIKHLQLIVPNCNTYVPFYLISTSFCTASFLGVVAISVDRFLAIHLHLRYQELVTHKRAVAVVISIWVITAFLPFLMLSIPLDIYVLIIVIGGTVGLVITTMVYIRIYLAVRRHKNQIQVLRAQQVAQAGEVAIFSSLVKSAIGTFYVYLVFLLCYLPFFISLVAKEMNSSSIVLKRFSLAAFTFVCLNSSLNPVIYCWKMRHIRHAVMNILRNMCWHRSRASHETPALDRPTMP